MKIVIANPPGHFPGNRFPCPFPSRWTSLFKDYPVFTFFPYELAYLSSLLKRELPQAQVKMVDGTWLRFTAEEYIRWLEWQKPDWLVFETDTVTYKETLKVARGIKQKLGTKIIMTGQYPTVFPHKVIEDGADYACIGEYEATVLDILKGNDPATIPGLFPKSHRKVLDIDWLPDPEDDDIRRIDYSYPGGCRWTRWRSVEVHAARGCPYSCDFCVAGTVYYEKNNWRFRKPERIIGEIQNLRRKYPGIEGVFFNEETHIVKKKTILEFCDAIIASGNNDLHFEAMANHQLLDDEILEALKRAGYYKLRIGIETVDPGTAKSIGRKTKADSLYRLLQTARKLGIEMYGTFIIGASGSTQKGDFATVEYGGKLLEERLLSSWQASIAVPHPGTPFHEKARTNGWLAEDDPEQYNGINGSVLNYPNYPKEQIRETIRVMGDRFACAVQTQERDTVHSEAGKITWLSPEERDAVRPRMKALAAAYDAGDDNGALAQAQEILAEYPQALRPRYVTAAVKERTGNREAARKGFEEIIALARDYNDAIQFAGGAHFRLGGMARDEGRAEDALRHFKQCMHLYPAHELARRNYWELETGNGKA
ncbi:MAG: radical SAM protein [Nitrospinae bacterium]|nr:radical SAM protein [Nitrospinota bacterium]